MSDGIKTIYTINIDGDTITYVLVGIVLCLLTIVGLGVLAFVVSKIKRRKHR